MSGLLQRVLLVAVVAAAGLAITLEDLDNIINNSPEDLCPMIDCVGAYSEGECPAGTRWIEGVFVGGCCGGCVRFQQENEECTGKIDSHCCNSGSSNIGSDYGNCNPPDSSIVNLVCNDDSFVRASSTSDAKIRKNSRMTSFMSSAKNADFLHRFRRSLTRSENLEPVSNILTSSWCDYGMYCNSDKCTLQLEWATCLNIRDAYDRDFNSGEYLAYRDDYRYRPECDIDEIYFAPKQCKSSVNDNTEVCVCVDKQGETIDGKAFSFQGDLFDDMNCLCSRRKHELQEAGASPTLHCQTNGNYEDLQCDGGWCYCVHPSNGSAYGYQMPEPAMNLLPCYNRTVIGDQYLRQCESSEHAHDVFVTTMLEKGILVVPSSPTTCALDGSYASRHCDGSSCSCFSKYNADCLVDGTSGCACMADKLVYDEYGRSYTGLECDVNAGVYSDEQHYTSQQAVYLVDADGIRVSSVLAETCEKYIRPTSYANCQTLGNVSDSSGGLSYCQSGCVTDTKATKMCDSSMYMFNVGEYNPGSPCV